MESKVQHLIFQKKVKSSSFLVNNRVLFYNDLPEIVNNEQINCSQITSICFLSVILVLSSQILPKAYLTTLT